MIEGITVLSQETINELPHSANVTIVIILLTLLVAVLVYLASNNTCVDIISLCIIGACIVSIVIVEFVTDEVPSGKYEYQVLIDDSVSFKEIYDKYEIMEVEGEIYTIRDKEGDTVADK